MSIKTVHADELGNLLGSSGVELTPNSPVLASVAQSLDTPLTILAEWDVTRYEAVLVRIDTLDSSGLNWACDWTFDGNQWEAAPGLQVSVTGGSATSYLPMASPPLSSFGTASRFATYVFPCGTARGFRLRQRSLTSGAAVFWVGLMADFNALAMPWWALYGQGAGQHGAAINGNPNRLAARALTASYTAVTTGQTADLISSLDGRLVTLHGSIPENTWSSVAASGGIVNTTGVTAKASAGAGLRNYVRSAQIANPSATATEVEIRDGASGTVMWRSKIGASTIAPVGVTFDPALRGSAATLVEVACVTTSTTTYINLQGWTAP